jgi:hypothetical protein
MTRRTLRVLIDSAQQGFDIGFRRKLSVLSAASFLASSLPPVFVDPLLEHHVRYGARQYPLALWFIVPLCVLTFMLTSKAMSRSKSFVLVLLPYLCAIAILVPVFRPEVPHIYIIDESILWLVIAILTPVVS